MSILLTRDHPTFILLCAKPLTSILLCTLLCLPLWMCFLVGKIILSLTCIFQPQNDKSPISPAFLNTPPHPLDINATHSTWDAP